MKNSLFSVLCFAIMAWIMWRALPERWPLVLVGLAIPVALLVYAWLRRRAEARRSVDHRVT